MRREVEYFLFALIFRLSFILMTIGRFLRTDATVSVARNVVIIPALSMSLLCCRGQVTPNSAMPSTFNVPCSTTNPQHLTKFVRPQLFNFPANIKATKGVFLKNVDPARKASEEEGRLLKPWTEHDFGNIVSYAQGHGLGDKKLNWGSFTTQEFVSGLNRLVKEKGVGQGIVYRGIHGRPVEDVLDLVKHYEEKSELKLASESRKIDIPVSTTTNPETALNFSCKNENSNRLTYGIVYRINTKHGYQLPHPFHNWESEVLLPPQTRFFVKRISIINLKPHNKLIQDRPKVYLADLCRALLVDLEEVL